MTTSAEHSARHMVDGTVWVFLADALVVPTGILTVAFLTRSLGPEGYGLFTLAAVIVGLVQGLIGTFFNRPTLKFIAESDDWRPIGNAIVKLHLGVSVTATILFWLASAPIANILQEPELANYLRLFALEMPLFALAHAHRSILIGTGAFRQRAVSTAGHWISRLLLIVILVQIGFSIYGAILGSIGASLVQLILCRIYVRPPLWSSGRFHVPGFWTYAGPLSLFAISVSVLGRVDLLLLKGLGGTASQSGIYGAAQNLTVVPQLVSMALSPLLLATLSRLISLGDLPTAKTTGADAMRAMLLLLPFAAMTAGMSHEIVQFIYGAEFLPAAPLLAMLIFASLAGGMVSLTTGILTAAGKPKWTVSLIAPLLPVALAGHWLLVPRFGATGAALVTTLCMGLGATAFVLAIHRVWKILPPLGCLVRSVLVCVPVFFAASFWSTPGPMLMVKLLAMTIFIGVSYWALREFNTSEIVMARSLFRRQRAHRLEQEVIVSED